MLQNTSTLSVTPQTSFTPCVYFFCPLGKGWHNKQWIPQRATWQKCHGRKSQVKTILYIRRIRPYFVPFDCWKLPYTFGEVVKQTNANSSPHACRITRCFRLINRTFSSVPFSVPALVTSPWPFINFNTASKCHGYMIEMLACRASNSHVGLGQIKHRFSQC